MMSALVTLQTVDGLVPRLLEQAGVPYAEPIGAAITFVVVLVAVYVVGSVLARPVLTRFLDRREMGAHARRPIKKFVRGLVVFAAIGVAFAFAGFGNILTSLATIAAAGTLAIGFAMQDVIRNFVAGVFIYTDKPFRVGDWIEWDGHSGVVEDISLRVSRVRTFDNELLTVPNSNLTDDVIKNPVANEKLRVKFTFGVGYDDDLERATDVIIQAAEDHDEILDDPGPSVRLTELGDSDVGLQSRIWIADPSRADFVRIRGEYVEKVKRRFDEAGIDIPYPQRVLHGGIAVEDSPEAAALGAED